MLQTEHQRLTRHCALDHLRVRGELIADRRANEVGAVGIKAFLHQQIDLP